VREAGAGVMIVMTAAYTTLQESECALTTPPLQFDVESERPTPKLRAMSKTAVVTNHEAHLTAQAQGHLAETQRILRPLAAERRRAEHQARELRPTARKPAEAGRLLRPTATG
jgi:hypothetical protein